MLDDQNFGRAIICSRKVTQLLDIFHLFLPEFIDQAQNKSKKVKKKLIFFVNYNKGFGKKILNLPDTKL